MRGRAFAGLTAIAITLTACGGGGAENARKDGQSSPRPTAASASKISDGGDGPTSDGVKISPGLFFAGESDGNKLVRSNAGRIFAFESRLGSVVMTELSTAKGVAKVVDRSSEFQPDWGTFSGNAMSDVVAFNSSALFGFAIAQNEKDGELLLATSTDGGRTFTTKQSAASQCGEFPGRGFAVGRKAGVVNHEACVSNSVGTVWLGEPGGGLMSSGTTVPKFNYTDTTCSTNSVAVLLHDSYDQDLAATSYTLYTSTNGTTWTETPVAGLNAPAPSDQRWLNCDPDGFSVHAEEAGGWLFDATGKLVSHFATPPRSERVKLTNGALVAFGFRNPVSVSTNGGSSWKAVPSDVGFENVSDVAVDDDGYLWVLAAGGVLSTAKSSVPPSTLPEGSYGD